MLFRSSGFADTLLQNIRVGDRIPVLPDRGLEESLHGVWEGPYEIRSDGSRTMKWLIFNRKGYYREHFPLSELETDMEARYIWNGEKPREYYIKKGKLVLSSGGEKRIYWYKKIDERRILIDDDLYERADGLLDRKITDGCYRLVENTSESIESAIPAIRFSGNREFRIIAGNEHEESQPAAEEKKLSGTYEISHDRIFLSFDDEHLAVHTIYPRLREGSIDNGGLFIDGLFYSLCGG